jgi:hypothetical protein
MLSASGVGAPVPPSSAPKSRALGVSVAIHCHRSCWLRGLWVPSDFMRAGASPRADLHGGDEGRGRARCARLRRVRSACHASAPVIGVHAAAAERLLVDGVHRGLRCTSARSRTWSRSPVGGPGASRPVCGRRFVGPLLRSGLRFEAFAASVLVEGVCVEPARVSGSSRGVASALRRAAPRWKRSTNRLSSG